MAPKTIIAVALLRAMATADHCGERFPDTALDNGDMTYMENIDKEDECCKFCCGIAIMSDVSTNVDAWGYKPAGIEGATMNSQCWCKNFGNTSARASSGIVGGRCKAATTASPTISAQHATYTQQATSGNIKLSISDCGTTSPVHIDSISPTSITVGETTTVIGAGAVDGGVSSLPPYTLNIREVRADHSEGVMLKTCKGDLCDLESSCDLPDGTGSIKFAGLDCPVSAGPVSVSMDVTISETFPDHFPALRLYLTDETTSNGLFCANILLALPDTATFTV